MAAQKGGGGKEFVKKLVSSVGLRGAEVGGCSAGPSSFASVIVLGVVQGKSFRLERGWSPDFRGLTVTWALGQLFQ